MQQLTPLDYGFVTGGLGGALKNLYSFTIYPSGMGLGGMGSAATVPQKHDLNNSAGTPGGLCLANGIYDRLNDTFAQVLWVSDKFQNQGGMFAKTQALQSTSCYIGGLPLPSPPPVPTPPPPAGLPLSNTYPRQIFNYNLATQTPIVNVFMPGLNEDAPPVFDVTWTVAMGAGCAGPLGQGCHVFVQIDSDDTIQQMQVPFGLGFFGNQQIGTSSSTPDQSGYGVIPGGSPNTVYGSYAVPVTPGVASFTRQWTYAGTFFSLQPCRMLSSK